jgi:hypothetical protein
MAEEWRIRRFRETVVMVSLWVAERTATVRHR